MPNDTTATMLSSSIQDTLEFLQAIEQSKLFLGASIGKTVGIGRTVEAVANV